MEFWISGILLLITVGILVFLSTAMRKAPRKTGYRIAMIALFVLAIVLLASLGCTVFFVSSIQ